MPISTRFLCIFVVVLLCGCEEWPPHEQEVKDHFIANEADIILLRDKLLDSKYLSVAELMGVEVYGQYYEGGRLTGLS